MPWTNLPIFAAVSQPALIMKKLALSVLAVLSLFLISRPALAQDALPPGESAGRFFSVGPIFTGGASTFAGDVADSYKIKLKTSFTFGALTEIDISPAIAFNLGLQYETRGRYWYKESNEDAFNYTGELSYLTISPLFNFRHVLLGFGIRLPMAGTLITDEFGTKTNRELPYSSLTTGKIEMSTPIEFKLGGNIEALETRGGTLNIIILGGFDLSPAFKTVSGTGPDAKPLFNPGQPEGSLHLGLNYLFNAVEFK